MSFFDQEEIGCSGIDCCNVCGLYKSVRSGRMEVSGKGEKKILLFGEAPGSEEDKKGEQFVGDSGTLLKKVLLKFGIRMNNDCWKLNAVNCRPTDSDGGNRKPTGEEIIHCYSRVEKTIKELNPDFIFAFGESALQSLFLRRGLPNYKISNWRRFCIPDYKYNCFIIPLFHPAFILRNDDNKSIVNLFERDLKWAVSCLDNELPEKPGYEEKVQLVKEYDELIHIFKYLKEEVKELCYDYETNHLDPRRPGTKVVSFAVCDGNNTISFPWEYKDHFSKEELSDLKEAWISILRDPEIKKFNQNIKFEETWNRRYFGVQSEGWIHDTMVFFHLLNSNREKMTGLKVQSYIKLGILGYESKIGRYMRSTKDGFNNLECCPLDELLVYGGMDTAIDFEIYRKNKKLMRQSWLRRIDDFYMESLRALMDLEYNGIRVDTKYYSEVFLSQTDQMKELFEKLKESPEAEEFSNKKGRPMNMSVKEGGDLYVSDSDLVELIYEVCDKPVHKRSLEGRPSLDEESLKKFSDLKFIDYYMKYKKIRHQRNTYVAGFLKHEVNGRINPIFNMHVASTGRSSCDNPNAQNIPVRDPEAGKLVRSGILPSIGNKLGEADYKSLEVMIIGAYSQDKNLLKYLWNPESDMHTDQACELFGCDPSQVSKFARYISKNGWVFPEFYGSWYKKCAQDIWDEIKGQSLEEDIPIVDWLRDSMNITSLEEFGEHLQGVETSFWRMFRGVKRWQESTLQFYEENGFVESKIGFRREGLLSRNEVVNTNIQGNAFHCLLWSLNKLVRISKEEEWRSKFIAQIHDSILFDLFPEEEKMVLETMNRVMTEDIKKEWDWLNVPLTAEFELTGVDESWYYKKAA